MSFESRNHENLRCPSPEVRNKPGALFEAVRFTDEGVLKIVCPNTTTQFQKREGHSEKIRTAICRITGQVCPYGAHPDGHVETNKTLLGYRRPDLAEENPAETRSPGEFVTDMISWLQTTGAREMGEEKASKLLEKLRKEADEAGISYEEPKESQSTTAAVAENPKLQEEIEKEERMKSEINKNPVEFYTRRWNEVKEKLPEDSNLRKLLERYKKALEAIFQEVAEPVRFLLHNQDILRHIKHINEEIFFENIFFLTELHQTDDFHQLYENDFIIPSISPSIEALEQKASNRNSGSDSNL